MLKDIKSYSQDNELIHNLLDKAKVYLDLINHSKSLENIAKEGSDLIKEEFNNPDI